MTIHNVTGVPMSDWATKRRWWCFFSHTCIQNKTEPYPNVDRISDVCCQIVIESYIGSFFPLTRTNIRVISAQSISNCWTLNIIALCQAYALPTLCVQIPLKIGTIDTVCAKTVWTVVSTWKPYTRIHSILEPIRSKTLCLRTSLLLLLPLLPLLLLTTARYSTVYWFKHSNDKINEWKQETRKQ